MRNDKFQTQNLSNAMQKNLQSLQPHNFIPIHASWVLNCKLVHKIYGPHNTIIRNAKDKKEFEKHL